jgi:hypothetical protein
MNNFVPVVSLATLANMDFQATTTKFGVVEYMTKYMTKAGQGSLLQIMEHSFSLCMERARDAGQQAGAAILKWFNLQSTADVKSQLETLHLAFRLPRFLSSRSFRRLAIRTESKRLKTPKELGPAGDVDVSLYGRSQADVYLSRGDLSFPSARYLQERHPVTGQTLSDYVVSVATGRSTASDSGCSEVEACWPDFLKRLSWWEFVRLFNVRGKSFRFKPCPDVVSVSPFPRLAKATQKDEWFAAVRNALLAYCNHGPQGPTFADAANLDTRADHEVEAMLRHFVEATPEVRLADGLCLCPPFLCRAWQLGQARKARAEQRRSELSEVLHGGVTFTFEEEDVTPLHWSEFLFEEMSAEQQKEAQEAWRESRDAIEPEEAPGSASAHPGTADNEQVAKMSRYMQRDLRWSHRDLHDAVRHLGFAAPRAPSMINYFRLLYAAMGDGGAAFAPQNARTHTKDRLSKCLRSLARGGAKLGGTSGSKSVIAQRLATVLGWVRDAGCELPDQDSEAEGDEPFQCGHKPSRVLVPVARPIAEAPADAVIDAVQAESALGHLAATEYDEDGVDSVDKDLRAEEEALVGRHVNPKGIDYSCLADAGATGWHQPLIPRRLSRSDFKVTLEGMQQRFRESYDEQKRA